MILFILVLLFGYVTGKETIGPDWKSYLLHFSILVGLLLAYKCELIVGLIATLGLLISGFIHPLMIALGILHIIYGVIKK